MAQFVSVENMRTSGRITDAFDNAMINHLAKASGLLRDMPMQVTKQRQGKSFFLGYSVIKKMVEAQFRLAGVEPTHSELESEIKTIQLAILTSMTSLERTTIEVMIAEDGTSELTTHVMSGIDSIAMLFEDAFINGDSATTNGQFNGIDKFAVDNNKVYAPDQAFDLRSQTQDGDFLFMLDNALSHIRAEGQIQKEIAIPLAFEPVFKRILRNSNQVTMTKDELGQELLEYGRAKIRILGDNAKGLPIIPIDLTTGTAPIYVYGVGQNAIHGATAFEEIIKTRLPHLQHMTSVIQNVGAEAVLGVVPKNVNAVAKLSNLKIAKGSLD